MKITKDILEFFKNKPSATAKASRRAASKFAHTNYIIKIENEELNKVSNALVRIKSIVINPRPLTDEESSFLIRYARSRGFDEDKILEAPKFANNIIQKIADGSLNVSEFANNLNEKLQQELPFSEQEFFVMIVLFILSRMQKQLPVGIRQLPPAQQESKDILGNKILENYNYFYKSWKTYLKG